MLQTIISLCIFIIIFLSIHIVTCIAGSDIYDTSSPIVYGYSDMVYEEGLNLLYKNNDIDGCLSHLLISFKLVKNPYVAYKLVEIYNNLGDHESSFNWLKNALIIDPSNITTLTDVGLKYHYQGHYSIAIEYYMKAIDILLTNKYHNIIHASLIPDTTPLPLSIESQIAEVFFTIGVSHQYAGNVELSAIH